MNGKPDKNELDEILKDLGRKYFEPTTSTRGQGGLPLHGSVIDWEMKITKDCWERYKAEAKTRLSKMLIEARIEELEQLRKGAKAYIVNHRQTTPVIKIYTIENRIVSLQGGIE